MKTSSSVIAAMLLSALLSASGVQSYASAKTQNPDAAAVMELVQQGSYYYMKHDFEAAIPPTKRRWTSKAKSHAR